MTEPMTAEDAHTGQIKEIEARKAAGEYLKTRPLSEFRATLIDQPADRREAVIREIQRVQHRDNHAEACDVADRILAAIEQETAPEGWQLVPKEPTDQMLIDAGTMANYDSEGTDGLTSDADHIEWWKAMLSAARVPKQKAQTTPDASAVVEAARRVRSNMNGHYVHAEDLYCLDEALAQYDGET